jgi:hypothetical protein
MLPSFFKVKLVLFLRSQSTAFPAMSCLLAKQITAALPKHSTSLNTMSAQHGGLQFELHDNPLHNTSVL